MNKERRTRLAAIAQQIAGLIEEAEALRDQEQDAFDNMPEGLQQSERGETMEQAIEAIATAIDGLEQAREAVDEAVAG